LKRRDFLQKMRNRRRRDQLELREPERRRSDWRTLRVDLPAADADATDQAIPIGTLQLRPAGVRLEASESCWVRGYRFWRAENGEAKAELQFRPTEGTETAPPGATALEPGEIWDPTSED
jgi:hypothetical protein